MIKINKGIIIINIKIITAIKINKGILFLLKYSIDL